MKKILFIIVVIQFCYLNNNAQTFHRSHAGQMYWTWRPDIADSCYEFTFENYFPTSSYPNLHGATICLMYWNDCNYGKNFVNVTDTFPFPFSNIPLHDTLFRVTSHYGIVDTFCGYDSPYQEGNWLNFCQVDAPHRKKLVYRGLIYLPEKCSKWHFSIARYNGIGETWSELFQIQTNGTSGTIPHTNNKSNIDKFGYSNYYDTLYPGGNDTRGILGCSMNNLNFADNSSSRFFSPPLYYFQNNKEVQYNPGAYDPDHDSVAITIIDTIKCSYYLFTPGGTGPTQFGKRFFAKKNVNGVPLDEMMVEKLLFAPLPGTTGSNPPRFNAVNNPFDTDSTFHLVDSTGKTTFTAKSEMEPVLYFKATNYVKGIFKSENYYVQPFVLINENREPSYMRLDTATISGVQFNSHGTMLACATQPISFEAYVKLPIVGSDLIVRTTADSTLPGNATCTVNGNHTDSVRLQFNWTPPANAHWLYNAFIMAKDSNCSPPYNHYLQVYTWSFYVDSCAGTIGINDMDSPTNDIIIYPNPATNTLHITCKDIGKVQYSIMNSIGQLVLSSEQKVNGNNINIPISSLANGVYFIRTRVKDKIHVQRFVKE